MSGEEAVKKVKERIGRSRKASMMATISSPASKGAKLGGTVPGYVLAIVDLNMPGMDGVETAQRILGELQEENKSGWMPIIGLTGDGDEAVVERCRNAGMVDVLHKPCGKSDVIRAIKRNRIELVSEMVSSGMHTQE